MERGGMSYPFWGLPGGSSGEGPATWVGVVIVAVATALVVAGIVAALFYATGQIDQPRVREPLVGSFASRNNA
jgi:hypothetical protein